MNKAILTTVAVLLLIGAGWLVFNNSDDVNLNPNQPGATSTPGTNNQTPPSNANLRAISPTANSEISSPVTVTGEARGTWYFEASFPISIVDANGTLLGQAPAQAQGEWMTTEFVPFRATVTFDTPTTETGFIVLEKDNPSGLPENADELRVPVSFSNSTSATRSISLYFYDEDRDKDASGNIECSADGLVRVERSIPRTNTPIQDSIRELLKGPTASEGRASLETEFPLSGVTLEGASLSSGVLTLRFNDPNNATVGGSCRVSILTAQIAQTAKQFSGVDEVRFIPEGVFQP